MRACHESPAGVSFALAVLRAEIPTRIDSCTVWGGVKQWKNQSFCLGRGGGRVKSGTSVLPIGRDN